jgi:hypothetical protein
MQQVQHGLWRGDNDVTGQIRYSEMRLSVSPLSQTAGWVDGGRMEEAYRRGNALPLVLISRL